MAEKNGVSLSLESSTFRDNLANLCAKSEHDSKHQEQWTSAAVRMFSSAQFRRRLLLLFPAWFAVGTAAYGIHFAMSLVQFNIFFIGACKEVLILILIIAMMFLLEEVGRKFEVRFSFV